jgi:ubiquinone/menaquinone biosynthesis C-methylase UbiE
MTQSAFGKNYAGSAPENYERYFVPVIGAPLARDLVDIASLRPGERVLDVACGTGVVTRLAAERVGPTGSVAGSDVNPGMLAVARSAFPTGSSVHWYETSAEAMPLPDDNFDVVFCQMGLQFFPNKLAALREMRRVLADGGRLAVNVPGPTPAMFSVLADALARHIDPEIASFAHLVFSLHDSGELQDLLEDAGFREVTVRAATKSLHLPPPEEFLWQYVRSTPLASAVAGADEERLAGLEHDVCAQWRTLMSGGKLTMPLGVTTAIASN